MQPTFDRHITEYTLDVPFEDDSATTTLELAIDKNNADQELIAGPSQTTKVEYVSNVTLQDNGDTATCTFKVKNMTANYQQVIIVVDGGLIYQITINATAGT